jgi:hypothetical protein
MTMSSTRWIVRILGTTVAVGVAACASTGTGPHEMSVAGHEAAAQKEQEAAAAHRSLHDPSLAESHERCSGGAARLPDAGVPCWTAVRNPTDEHVRMSEQHRKLAEKHRAAAQVLRDAEARACVGVSAYDRDVSPFAHREDIAAVAPITGRVSVGKGGPLVERTYGARITFHDVPGLTAPRLRQIIDCHLARNAALGHDLSEMPYCPLVPNGVTAQVQQTESGHVVVEVRSDEPQVAQEVWNRAAQLKP